MASLVSSALHRLHHCCCCCSSNTRTPLHTITAPQKHRPQLIQLFTFTHISEDRGWTPVKTRSQQWTYGVNADTVHLQSVIYLLDSPEGIFISHRRIGDKAVQQLKFNTTEGGRLEENRRTYRSKIRLIHRSLQGDLRFGGSADVFLLRVGVFPSHWHGIAEGDPSLPIQEGPVAAVRTDDDDGDWWKVPDNNRQHIRFVFSQ